MIASGTRFALLFPMRDQLGKENSSWAIACIGVRAVFGIRALPFAAAVSLCVALPARVHATTLVVSPTGTNGATCGAPTSPCKTIAHAYSLVAAGDTILVKPGTYKNEFNHTWSTGEHVFRLTKDGTEQNPITLRSDVPLAAIIDALDSPMLPSVLSVSGNHHVIEGFKLVNGSHDGIVVWGSHNRFLGNEVAFNGNHGDPTSSYGHDGIYTAENTAGNQFLRNYIHHNGRPQCGSSATCNLDHGLYLCGDGELVANNISANNSSYGLQIAGYQTVSGMRVFHNVFAKNGRSGFVVWHSASDVLIQNNICYENAQHAAVVYDYLPGDGDKLDGVVISNNIFYGNKASNGFYFPKNGGAGAGYSLAANQVVDPMFANASANDFRLSTASSPAVDAGEMLAQITTDFAGTARPQGSGWDIGAYEWSDSSGGASGGTAGSAGTGAGGGNLGGAAGNAGTSGGGTAGSAGTPSAGNGGAGSSGARDGDTSEAPEGCSCHAAGSGRVKESPILAAAALLWLWIRRRRRAAAGCLRSEPGLTS